MLKFPTWLGGTRHVLFGMSASGTFRKVVADLPVQVACIPDNLSFGPTNPMDSDRRVEWAITVLGYDWDAARYASLSEQAWADATAEHQQVVVWLNRNQISEYTGYLYLCSRMSQPFAVIDTTNTLSPRYGRAYKSTGEIPAAEFEVIIRDWLLSPVEAESWQASRTKWNELAMQDAPLRVLHEGFPVSAKIDHFDGLLVGRCTANWQPIRAITGTVQSFDHFVLSSRLYKLSDTGVLEIQEDLTSPGSDAIRLGPKGGRPSQG